MITPSEPTPPGNANLRIGSAPKAEGPIQNVSPTMKPSDPWYSRGYLPHVRDPNLLQHITFHLADSVPKSVIEHLDAETKVLPRAKRNRERRQRVEAWLDAGFGSCILRDAAIACMVQNTLLHFDGDRYLLLAWVVMPNHVHALVETKPGWDINIIVASWKKFTASRMRSKNSGLRPARRANAEIGVPGRRAPVWHREYWDRFIRDDNHLLQTIEYIHQNPVRAKFARSPQDWTWSSAFRPEPQAWMKKTSTA